MNLVPPPVTAAQTGRPKPTELPAAPVQPPSAARVSTPQPDAKTESVKASPKAKPQLHKKKRNEDIF